MHESRYPTAHGPPTGLNFFEDLFVSVAVRLFVRKDKPLFQTQFRNSWLRLRVANNPRCRVVKPAYLPDRWLPWEIARTLIGKVVFADHAAQSVKGGELCSVEAARITQRTQA